MKEELLELVEEQHNWLPQLPSDALDLLGERGRPVDAVADALLDRLASRPCRVPTDTNIDGVVPPPMESRPHAGIDQGRLAGPPLGGQQDQAVDHNIGEQDLGLLVATKEDQLVIQLVPVQELVWRKDGHSEGSCSSSGRQRS
jgi:hypothetical protein